MFSILNKMWIAIGAPSYISGTNLVLLISFAKYVYKKFHGLKDLEDKIILLNIKLENLDRLLNTRINDIEK